MRRFSPRFWLRVAIVCWIAAVAVALAACGSVSVQRQVGPTSPTVVRCPPGRSFMGCAITSQPGITRAVGLTPPGCKFPDVSLYQGHPNWGAVKAWQLAAHCTPGGAFKIGEAGFGEDPDAAYNAGQLHALHMAAIGYWFVHAGCSQSVQLIALARALGLHVVTLDMEVANAYGMAPCLAAALHHAGFVVLIYTGPGTWPGGGNAGLPLWQATYNFSDQLAAFWRPLLAWQFTDSHIGPSFYVPGVGYDDVSVDYGLLKLAAPPLPKPSPFAIFPLKPVTLYHQKISERLTVERWYTAKCSNPVRRVVCRMTRTHLTWLAGRLLLLAEAAGTRHAVAQPTRDDWAPNHWGARHYRIERILHGR